MTIDAYILPLAVALLALATQSLDWKGVLVSLVLAYFIVLWTNVYWLIILLILFVLGSIATRVRFNYKNKYGLGQRVRSTENVLANGLVAVIMVFFGSFYGFVGAVSTATADTLSSEMGVLSKRRPRLITTWRPMQTGTNGAVSGLGTLFAFVGAITVGIAAALVAGSYVPFVVSTVIGVTGCFVDSYVGATVERRGLIGNWQTNLIATTFGGVAGFLISLIL